MHLGAEIVQSLWRRGLGVRDGAERRGARRIRTRPLALVVDGARYETLDWSLGGFRIAPLRRSFQVRDQFSGTVAERGRIRGGDFTAEVVWVRDGGLVGCRFLDIASPTFVSMTGLASH